MTREGLAERGVVLEGQLVLGTQKSAVFTPTEGWMRVRGGGIGGSAWVAVLTGPDPKYHFARRFLRAEREALSRSGRSGTISWDWSWEAGQAAASERPLVLEFRSVCVSSSQARSGYAIIADGGIAELPRALACRIVIGEA